MATNNDNGSKQVLTGERPMPRFFDWKKIDKVPELFDKDSSSQDKDSEHFVPAIQELINFTGPVGAGLSMEERERECYRIHNRLYDLFQTSYKENEMLAIFFHNSPNAVRLEFLKEKYDNAQATIDGLIEKEFIVDAFYGGCGNCFKLTEEALIALKHDNPYVPPSQIDAVQTLRDTALADLLDDDLLWLEKFNFTLENRKNADFMQACEDLGVFSLSKAEQVAFWALTQHFVQNFLDPLAFIGGAILSPGGKLLPDTYNLRENLNALVKSGLADCLPVEKMEETKETDRFVLSYKAAGTLFKGHEEVVQYKELSKYGNVIKAGDIRQKELFFSETVNAEIGRLHTMLSPEGFERASKILIGKKRKPCIQCLLWGPPGTGKTEVVKQLARETGRDLIIFESSKVLASAWGESEKNHRALFRGYKYAAAISNRAPILLLNEADTILNKRFMGVSKSIDKGENNLVNIILQEFEDACGIILATTNLADNIDEAFDRRFLFKTEMHNPDRQAQASIWRASIPELTDGEAMHLASMFDMTGAQIDNVAAKRDLAELYYTGDRGLGYIEGLCREELSGSVGKCGSSRRIGF